MQMTHCPSMQAQDADTSAATDCTDYSGLGDAAAEKDKNLNDVLAEVNQRHEWAMEVCIHFAIILGL